MLRELRPQRQRVAARVRADAGVEARDERQRGGEKKSELLANAVELEEERARKDEQNLLEASSLLMQKV